MQTLDEWRGLFSFDFADRDSGGRVRTFSLNASKYVISSISMPGRSTIRLPATPFGVIVPPDEVVQDNGEWWGQSKWYRKSPRRLKCPFGEPGDIVEVRSVEWRNQNHEVVATVRTRDYIRIARLQDSFCCQADIEAEGFKTLDQFIAHWNQFFDEPIPVRTCHQEYLTEDFTRLSMPWKNVSEVRANPRTDRKWLVCGNPFVFVVPIEHCEPVDKLPATPAKQPQRSDRRDRIATAAMQAFIGVKPGYCAETVARDAVAFADALIDRLDAD